MWIHARGRAHWRARKRMSSLLAAPPAGGAATRIFSASPWMPALSVTRAFGWTWTARRTPFFVYCTKGKLIQGERADDERICLEDGFDKFLNTALHIRIIRDGACN